MTDDLQYFINIQIVHYILSAINQHLFIYARSYLIIYSIHFIDLISTIFLLIFGLISLFIFHLGLEGYAISFILFHLIRLILIIVYIKKNNLHLCLFEGNITGVFSKMKELFKLSIPASLDYTFEILVPEILAIYLVKLGKEELVAHYAVESIYSFFINFPYGLGVSLQTLVGNYFGKQNINKLKQLKKIGMISSIILSISCSIIAIMLRSVFFSYLIQVKESEEIFNKAIIIGIINFSVNCIIYFQCYYLVGLAMQFECTVSSLIGKTIINLLFGIIFLRYTNLGAIGVWIATLLGLIISLIINFWNISKISYEKLLAKLKND